VSQVKGVWLLCWRQGCARNDGLPLTHTRHWELRNYYRLPVCVCVLTQKKASHTHVWHGLKNENRNGKNVEQYMRGYTIQLKANKRKEVSIKSEHIRLLHEHEAAAQRPKLFDVQDRLDSTRLGVVCLFGSTSSNLTHKGRCSPVPR
jgi:hypothetical protein